MGRLDGRVAIVTGGARGVGRGEAMLLAAEGAKVVVADINDDEGARVVREISDAGGTARYTHADVADSAANQAMVHTARRVSVSKDRAPRLMITAVVRRLALARAVSQRRCVSRRTNGSGVATTTRLVFEGLLRCSMSVSVSTAARPPSTTWSNVCGA